MFHPNQLLVVDRIGVLDQYFARQHEKSMHRIVIDIHRVVQVLVNMIPANYLY